MSASASSALSIAEQDTQSVQGRATGRSGWKTVAEFVVVAVCTMAFVAVLVNVCLLLLTGRGGESRDFISYWAAGHQLAAHHDPYDAANILRLQLSAGMNAKYAAGLMRNPPSALALVLPLSLFGVRTGSLVWSVALLASLVVSVFLLWQMNGRPQTLFRLFGYTFGPALACILVGQTSLFALLGLVLFLHWQENKPFLAGTSLWLCLLKPHLFLPLAAVLVLWIVTRKSYRIVLGTIAALGLSCMAAFFFDPSTWTHYRQMMTTTGIEGEFIPCLSVALRLRVNPGAMYLQFVPAAFGVVWAVRYFFKRRLEWQWAKDVHLVLMLSFLVAPYAWFTDQAILLPAVLYAGFATKSRTVLMVLALGSAAIQIELLLGVSFHSAIHIVSAPAWMAWYLWAIRRGHADTACELSPLPPTVTA